MDASTAGVEQVEDAATETIRTPTDDQVAIEIDAIVNPRSSSSTPSATASTSSSSSSGMAFKVHLQAPKSKRYTPAAKQCQELTATMLEAFKNESQKLVDDEDELSFAGYAKRMRLFLTNDQKEELNTEIGNLVSTAIRNVKAGMPVLQKAPVYRQASAVQVTSNMQNHQQHVEPHPLLDLPQPPQLQPVPQQVQAQQDNVPADGGASYIHGPTSMNYKMTRNLDFNTM